ncbi:internal scaffolding protein VP3 [Gokushovirinae Fen7875_21]|uniref:internal scaffolding protein VP3 n=1 Tax=Gokushovirinae Fen7875_21 TaxID=1655659 RepID=UPI00063D5BA3|nr:internal scaffolding protein VP3 [Gokushovirinae Fen7875_21]AKI26938.1 internal scaffolding protein VP3 [Gokushovirinae Fen7875_21]ALS03709.1 VP3 [Gokushovirus WZ-2015a]
MSKFSSLALRTFNNYDTRAASDESALFCPEPTMAQQHPKEECDINTIVNRFGLTGELPTGVRAPQYGDFTGLGDFRDALEAIQAADAAFMQMPAAVRYRFHNNPAEFVDFCSNPFNYAEAESLGLVIPKAPLTPTSPGPTPEGGGGQQQQPAAPTGV